MCVCIYIYIYICVCVCVCVRVASPSLVSRNRAGRSPLRSRVERERCIYIYVCVCVGVCVCVMYTYICVCVSPHRPWSLGTARGAVRCGRGWRRAACRRRRWAARGRPTAPAARRSSRAWRWCRGSCRRPAKEQKGMEGLTLNPSKCHEEKLRKTKKRHLVLVRLWHQRRALLA